jgi:hypothetical protein
MIRRPLLVSMLFTAVVILAWQPLHGGDEKGSPWKPFLSEADYAELTRRSMERIAKLAASDDKKATDKIHVEAAVLAGYTFSHANGSLALRDAAVRVALKKGDVELAKTFAQLAADKKGKGEIRHVKSLLPETSVLMTPFRSEAKGGEGIHPDLQYQPKLKNQNGIEALLNALGQKKLTDENAAKVSKELSLLGRRIAVYGSLTHEAYAPDAKDAKQWRELSVAMRDAGVELAEAASKKDSDGILTATRKLETSCIDCHSAFRK